MSEQVDCGQGPTLDAAGGGPASVTRRDGAPRPNVAPGRPAFSPPRFQGLAEVGRGGTGVVYKARQLGADRLVALKVLRSGGHAGPEDLARLRTEALAVARVAHPGVVRIYEVGAHEGQPFLCLEWVDGGSL